MSLPPIDDGYGNPMPTVRIMIGDKVIQTFTKQGGWGAVRVSSAKSRNATRRTGERPAMRRSQHQTFEVTTPDGRTVFEFPGLTVRAERLWPVLDKLAEHNVDTIELEHLRSVI